MSTLKIIDYRYSAPSIYSRNTNLIKIRPINLLLFNLPSASVRPKITILDYYLAKYRRSTIALETTYLRLRR